MIESDAAGVRLPPGPARPGSPDIPAADRRRPTSWGLIGLLSLLVFATWKCGTPFFWRDDWLFLVRFMHVDPRFLLAPHAGHFVPLFKLAYLGELFFFGVNVPLFHLVGLAIYALICGSFFLLLRSLLDHELVALFFAALLAVHPINFVVLLWPFQLGILMQLLFQIGAMRAAFGGGERGHGLPLFLLLLAQQLSFGNGHFFPLAVAAVLLLFHGSRPRARRLAALAALLSLGFVLGQYLLMRQLEPGGVGLLARWARYPADLAAFVLLTLARAALVLDAIVSRDVAYLAALALLTLGAWLSWKDRWFARRLAAVLAWLLATTAIVPLVRAASAEVNHYYTTLAILPAICYLALVTSECARRLALGRRFLLAGAWVIGATGFLLAIGLLDQRLVAIFESRNARNRQAFAAALAGNEPYRPFDDPVFGGGPGLHIAPADALRAYLYWRQHAVLPDLNRY